MKKTKADQTLEFCWSNAYPNVGVTPTSNLSSHQLTFSLKHPHETHLIKYYIFKSYDCNIFCFHLPSLALQGVYDRWHNWRNSSRSLEACVCIVAVNNSFVRAEYSKHFSLDLKSNISTLLLSLSLSLSRSVCFIYSPTRPTHQLIGSLNPPQAHIQYSDVHYRSFSSCKYSVVILPYLCSISYFETW